MTATIRLRADQLQENFHKLPCPSSQFGTEDFQIEAIDSFGGKVLVTIKNDVFTGVLDLDSSVLVDVVKPPPPPDPPLTPAEYWLIEHWVDDRMNYRDWGTITACRDEVVKNFHAWKATQPDEYALSNELDVSSYSGSDMTYKVRLWKRQGQSSDWTCTCGSFRYGGGVYCKHILDLAELNDD